MLGILILFIATELRFGGQVFLAQIPTLLFAFMTIPNLSFWANYSLDLGMPTIISFFYSKLLFCFAFWALWSIHSLYFKRYPRFTSVIFCGFVGLSILYVAIRAKDIKSGDAFKIKNDVLLSGEWVGMELPMTEADKRLFSSAEEIARKIYYNDTNYISLLAISSADKSKIHPAEICIKSTGESVISSRQIYLNVKGKKSKQTKLYSPQMAVSL